jgi:hypothetical protein
MKSLSLGILAVLTACAIRHPQVPLIGAQRDIAALTGEWAGDYSSAASGRSGSISFALRTAGDSAFGDVTMIPAGLNRPLTPWRDPSAPADRSVTGDVLTIRFVRIVGTRVSGTLDPYADPVTGIRLFTTFVGELQGNVIEGTYTTRLPSGEEQSGRWTVERS